MNKIISDAIGFIINGLSSPDPPICEYLTSKGFREIYGIPQDGSRHFRLFFRIPLLPLSAVLSIDHASKSLYN